MASKEQTEEVGVVKSDDKYFVGRVAVQTEPVIVDSSDETQLSLHEAVAKLLCIVEKLSKKLD